MFDPNSLKNCNGNHSDALQQVHFPPGNYYFGGRSGSALRLHYFCDPIGHEQIVCDTFFGSVRYILGRRPHRTRLRAMAIGLFTIEPRAKDTAFLWMLKISWLNRRRTAGVDLIILIMMIRYLNKSCWKRNGTCACTDSAFAIVLRKQKFCYLLFTIQTTDNNRLQHYPHNTFTQTAHCIEQEQEKCLWCVSFPLHEPSSVCVCRVCRVCTAYT